MCSDDFCNYDCCDDDDDVDGSKRRSNCNCGDCSCGDCGDCDGGGCDGCKGGVARTEKATQINDKQPIGAKKIFAISK
jgi:hypothetical protein